MDEKSLSEFYGLNGLDVGLLARTLGIPESWIVVKGERGSVVDRLLRGMRDDEEI